MGIFIPGFWRSCAISKMNANALPERCIRKDLRRNRLVRYSRISMVSTTARRVFRGCWTFFARMSLNDSRALWRRINQSSSSIAYILKIHRRRSVETEAFYVVFAVREDMRCEVLGIFNKPTESALGWGEMLTELQERGVRKIGLVCADRLKGLEDVISAVFPGTPLQCCTTYLKCNLLNYVCNGDKGELAEDLRQVFLPYGGSQLYGRESLGTMAGAL